MIRVMVLCGALAVALPFVISSVASRFGPAVSERFLERPTELPAEVGSEGPLDASLLRAWAMGSKDPKTAAHAKGYARWVMLFDLAYLVSLGLFLGLAASYAAGLATWPAWVASRPNWVWWILPGAYIAFDFAEDSLIFVLLTWPSGIADASLQLLSFLRFVKIVSVGGAMGVAVLLGLLSFI